LLLARAAADMQVKKFVGIGTCFEYDLDYGNLSTATPLKASSIYSAAKISTFLSLTELFKNKETPFLWCRLFYLFGEGENPKRLVSYVRSRIQAGEPVELTSGDQIRDYLDVKEAANVIVESTLSEKSGPINICSSIPITVRELVERIADEYNRRDLLRFGSRPENQIDPKVIVGIKT
jgi:dTDP-6-deoxy-L-talose 4-dehydrogenase (NAD+)